MTESLSALAAASCIALLATVTGLWGRRSLWVAGLIVVVVSGYVSGVMHGPAVVWVVLLAGLLWSYRRGKATQEHPLARAVRAIGLAIVTVLLGMHALPGFDNPLLLREAVMAPDAAPYTLYFNFDKTLAGVLLIGLGSVVLLRSGQEWRQALRLAVPIIAINIAVAMALSQVLGYVRFQPNWNELFWTWAVANLLLTCLSEEAFFRGFIQLELGDALRHRRYGNWVAIAASASLFGLAHFAGGWRYVLLATLAGAGYAIVFDRTRRIEMAMLAHFALNATHFLLFTYPRLAAS